MTRSSDDSTLRVPERGNGVPDVLDEARWELDFLLRMQVPEGKPMRRNGVPQGPRRRVDGAADPPRTGCPDSASCTARPPRRRSIWRPRPRSAPGCSHRTTRRSPRAAWTPPAAHGRRRRPTRACSAPASDSTGGGAYEDADVSGRVLLGGRRTLRHHRRGAVPGRRDRLARITPGPGRRGSAGAAPRARPAHPRHGPQPTCRPPNSPGCAASVTSAADGYLADHGRPGIRGADPRDRLRLGLQQRWSPTTRS